MVRMRLSVCWARYGIARLEQFDDVIDFVQHLLEPQLVDLVDDDEEHLVVLGSFGPRTLERQQLVDGEIAAVGHRSVGHDHSLRDLACAVALAKLAAWACEIHVPEAANFNRLDSARPFTAGRCRKQAEICGFLAALVRHVACSMEGEKLWLHPTGVSTSLSLAD